MYFYKVFLRGRDNMANYDVRIEGSFELLSDEEWDRYLGITLFDKIKIDLNKFDRYKERIFLYPLLEQSITAQNNKVGSMMITYALCRHYYDKGIPDEPWYKSPGDNGESIQYMPKFKDEHWMRRYWFNHFAESMYLKFFSTWDCITELLDIFYGSKIEHNTGFKFNVLKWLKKNKPEIADYLEENVYKSPLYVQASVYRNDFTHGIAPSEISNGFILKKDELVDIIKRDVDGKPILDNQQRIITEKKKATVLSCGVGDYTNVSTVMDNIDCFALFMGEKITSLVNLILA